MKYDFITIGGLVEDVTFRTDEGVLIDNPADITRQKLVGFEYGAKISIREAKHFPGGGANNAAVCFSRLGFKTAMLGAIGEDATGKMMMQNLVDHGIDTRLIKTVREADTGFSFIVKTKNNEHVAFVYRGANSFLTVGEIEEEMLASSKWLYIASLSGEWGRVLDKIFDIPDALIVWNPGNAQLAAGVGQLHKYLKKTAVLMLNNDEAIELVLSVGKYKKEDEEFFKDVKNLLLVLKELGPDGVVITSGNAGADYYDGEDFYHGDSLRVPQAKITDTTGVGDAFCSTFIAGLEMHEGDFKKAMKLAMKNAAGVLLEPGAQNGLMRIKK
jgi:ribokinase